jgi:hypothetical protein
LIPLAVTHHCLNNDRKKAFVILKPESAFKHLSCIIFEHFAILPDTITQFLKLGSAILKQGTILTPKQADPLSLLNKQIHPFHLDRVSSQTQIQ